jgi:HAD superfamily hydrolase (TIGR01484 family)
VVVDSDSMNMLRLAAFDLDGTLAEQGGSITATVGEQLRSLQSKHVRICIASGKNFEYLQAKVEAVQLKDVVLLAENGCVVFSRDRVLRKLASTAVESNVKEGVYQLCPRVENGTQIASALRARFNDSIRFQENRVQISVFPRDRAAVPELVSALEKLASAAERVVAHPDAVDVMPSDWDKGRGLARLQECLGISIDETVAVGNDRNDLPMFGRATQGILVGDTIEYAGATHYPSIMEALRTLEAMASG